MKLPASLSFSDVRPGVPGCVGRAVVLSLLALCLSLPAFSAHAQSEAEDGGPASFDEVDASGIKLTAAEAARILALPVPEAADARYAALQRQYEAARLLEDQVRLIATARQLIDAGRGHVGGEDWILAYLNAEFVWGSSGAALEACEPFIADTRLSLDTRAAVALRQTYFAAQGHDRLLMNRFWSRADDLAKQAMKQATGMSPFLPVNRLQVRSEIERWQGESAAAVATLREAVGVARLAVAATQARSGNARSPAVLDAYNRLDGSLGMLTYALVRQGRAQEAIDVAEENLALWRAGKLTDVLGARWNYRLATSLNSTQQYEAGLAAARLSDEMLQRAGSSAASHTRWLARQEVVRGLIGLKRWKEADESYREFLAAMPVDLLARTRASNWRLLALLAAENGRYDEALEIAERYHRYRTRLYGAQHPQTQEAAGVRAVVHLLRGDIRQAMIDYEELFAATLDSTAGWLDLDLRGVRGYVLGIAFDEFMRYVAERAVKGEALDAAITDRALQIADRSNLSATQRALTDSTARVLATTPALRALLDEEQTQRQLVAALFGKLNNTLTEEDRLRRERSSEAFKALPESERHALGERLKAVREQIPAQKDEAVAARAVLSNQREAIARQFPAYADLVTPATPRPEQLRRLLGPGEAMLVVYPAGSATLVWLIGAEGHNGFSASKLTRDGLTRRIVELRTMLDIAKTTPGSEPALQPAMLHALYREMLAPLEAPLRDVRSLIIATNGPLASLPLGALVSSPPTGRAPPAWLIRQMAVTQLPSPSSLLALRRVAQPKVAEKALLGFGDPLFKLASSSKAKTVRPTVATGKSNPMRTNLTSEAARYDAEWGFRYADMPPLPETRTELVAVAAALGADEKTDLVLGAQATRRAVIDADLLDRRVVAFATHGLMPGELPGISKPSLAMAANANERESPLLELDDVLGLRLNAQWVLLSACNTAAGEQGGGAMSGLVRGFFFAGARSVLATHWSVESESAAALSTATLKAYANGAISRSQSLRQAQLAMIDGQIGGGKWSHPYYWAPYALFGDPAH
ncbi:MAG: CHAT domain-containing protein [Propionivibrio sp.]|nr:CHAT domain-containing protein [Propionivibrio sp.]